MEKSYYEKEADFMNSITVNEKPIFKLSAEYLSILDECDGFIIRKEIKDMIGKKTETIKIKDKDSKDK